jgi:transposase
VALGAPSLPRITAEAPQRAHSLREGCNGRRGLGRAGAAWRMLPLALPPGPTGSQQSPRWLQAGAFEALVPALRAVLRLAQGRKAAPSAAILARRPLQSTPESGTRAGDEGAKRRRGATVQRAGEMLGPLLAAHVTAANEHERRHVRALAATGQEGTGAAVALAWVDQGSPGAQAAQDAETHQRQLDVVQLPEAKKGCVLRPKRWVVERSHAWAARFRRLARDDARLAATLAGLPFVACALLRLTRFIGLIVSSA